MGSNNSEIPILQTTNISKSFGHVQALKNVDLDLYPSEVVALIGDNGAGKSTLIKIISGIYQRDSGEVLYKGEKVDINEPKDAVEKAGVSTVYQDLSLVEVQDVGVNIYLNMEPTFFGIFINYKKLYKNAEKLIKDLKIELPSVRVNVADLSGGQRQGVAIARALARGREIFILDEPTAALGVEQQANVNKLILKLKEDKKTVLLISHNLEHVFEVADRLVILRRGEKVGERVKESTSKEEVVGLITGAIK
ncbi:MAG: ATP-binding cassette domain-containing protein [SAR324 cluster bacterium]|nr:ATP-binding cassette domain-containing protein [SAR324 cluster bacterium]